MPAARKPAPTESNTPKVEKVTASAGFTEDDSLTKVVGDVVEALVAEGADLAKGVTVKAKDGLVEAEGVK